MEDDQPTSREETSGKARFGIQSRLLQLLLIILVPVLLIQAFVYYHNFQARKAEELRANLEIARAVAKTFETFVQDVLHQESAIGLALTVSQSLSLEEQNSILDKGQAEQPIIWNLGWVNPEGNFVAAGVREAIGKNLSDWKHIQKIVAGGDWAISDLLLTKVNSEPAFSIARGVRNEQGDLLGIVVAVILPDRLESILNIQRSEGGGHALVDSHGMLVYRFPGIKTLWEQRNWIKDFPQFAEALRGKEIAASVFAPFEGKKRLVGFTPAASIGWAVSAGRTEEVAMRAITSQLLPEAILFLLVTFAAFSTALVLSRFISTPVKRLRDHALSLGRGETHIPAIAAGPAEIGELADSFNIMSEELQSRERSLQDQREWLRVTLTSIGDAVMATDTAGRITFLNPIAAALIGRQIEEVVGQSVQEVFRTINEQTRAPAEDVVNRVLREGCIVALANHTALITRDGREIPIEDSAAPIKDDNGNVSGVVLVFHDVTDKRRARDALRESERNYRSLFDNMLDGFAYCKMLFQDNRPEDFEYIAVNPAFEKLTGLKNVVGKKVTEVIPGIKESNSELFETYGRVALTGQPERFEIYLAQLEAWLSVSVYSTEKGYFVAVFDNITKRKKVEAELRRAHDELEFRVQERTAELEKISERLKDEVAERERAQEALRVSNRFLEIANRHSEIRPLLKEFVEEVKHLTDCRAVGIRILEEDGEIPYYAYDGFSRSFFEQESPLSIKSDHCMCINVVKGTTDPRLPFYTEGGSFYMNTTTRFLATVSEEEKGQTRNVCNQAGYESVALVPILMRDQILGLIHVADSEEYRVPIEIVQVMERAAMELGMALKRVKAEQAIREQAQLLDLAHDSILVRGMDGKILFWNKGAEKTYGWLREEALGRSIHALLGTQFPKPLEELTAGVFTTGKWEGELRHLTRNGESIIADSRWAIQRDESGNPSGILEVNRDITDKKRAEDELEIYMKKLEQSNRALQEFASIASHDMQEPLRKVKAFGDRLNVKCGLELGAQGKDYLGRMLSAAERMQSLLDALLKYSRVSTQTEPFVPVNLNELIQEVLSDLEARIEQTGGRVEIGDLPEIEADPSQMRQLFQNLIGNGLKYHGEEEPLVKVYGQTLNGQCRICIEDNGIGFDEKYGDKIFQPFQRLHGKNSPYEGTGMGLAICRKIAERHGGNISAESTQGKGSIFIVSLPVQQPSGEVSQ